MMTRKVRLAAAQGLAGFVRTVSAVVCVVAVPGLFLTGDLTVGLVLVVGLPICMVAEWCDDRLAAIRRDDERRERIRATRMARVGGED